MPKARKEQTERAIRSAAWELFFEKGVFNTTYSDLAEVSGISRSLVQRYVPKKELLVEWCAADLRQAAEEVCYEAYPQQISQLARLYLLRQVIVASYFAYAGINRFMLDVFSSRELTLRAVVESFRWAARRTLPERHELLDVDDCDALVVAAGGLFELVYFYLQKGRTPDFATIALPSVRVFGDTVDLPEPREGLETYAITQDELLMLGERVIDRIVR